MISIYRHPVQPEDYPAFHSRCAKAVTRTDLDDRIRFTVLRAFSMKDNQLVDYKRDLDLYTKELELGEVIWPVYPTLFADNFDELVEEIKARGLWLFDFWGYVPGSWPEENNIWGEYTPPPAAVESLKKLGGHFLGFDNGEQDGRYLSYASQQCPAPINRAEQFAAFQAFFEKMGNHLHNHISVLASLTFLHPFAQEGNTVILGAETGQALPCANMWYSFIRGAGKQYGLLWIGNASIFNRWGYKCYESVSDGPGYEHGPEAGTSLSLLRRLMFTEYMYNSDILGFEQSWIVEDNVEKRIKGEETAYQTAKSVRLSPVGLIQQQMASFVKQNGRPGIHLAPVTVFTDFHSGWVPPRHLYNNRLYEVWGSLPYEMGDYQLHALFDMIYPGYEDAGFFRSERGFLTPTPYGDITDVTCSDAPAEILNQYNTALVFGHGKLEYESFWKLRRFAQRGGRVVLGIEKLLNADWDITPWLACFGLNEIRKTRLCKDLRYENQPVGSGEIELIEVVAAGTAVIQATADGLPYILTQSRGEGCITLICSPYGLEKNPAFDPAAENIPNRSVEPPYRFQKAVKTLLEQVFNEQLLFKVNNPLLQFSVNCKAPGEYQLLVVNNTPAAQRFDVMDGQLKIGRIQSINVPNLPPEELGWLPKSEWLSPPDSTGSGHYEVAAGDLCLFILHTDTPVHEKTLIHASTENEKYYLSIHSPTVKAFLTAHPSFCNYFRGVKIPASALEQLDEKAINKEAEWVRRQGVDVIVDFTGMLNHYPNTSLLYNVPGRTEEGLERIRSILRKSVLYRTDKVIFSLQRNAENGITGQQAETSLKRALKEISDLARQEGITCYLQNSRSLGDRNSFSKFTDTLAIARETGFKTTLNVGHSLALGEEMDVFRPDGILLNAPQIDLFGQCTDAHLPISGSAYQQQLLDRARRNSKNADFVCLDSAYTDWNQIIMDIEILSKEGQM